MLLDDEPPSGGFFTSYWVAQTTWSEISGRLGGLLKRLAMRKVRLPSGQRDYLFAPDAQESVMASNKPERHAALLFGTRGTSCVGARLTASR
jgi:hypothetical protein